jgi:hypothetical protein
LAAFQVASSLGPHPLWAAIRAKSIFLARCATSRGRLSTRSSATAKFCLRTALAGAEEAQILELLTALLLSSQKRYKPLI